MNQKCDYGSRNEEDDDTANNEEEYTTSKSHWKPHLQTLESNRQKLMTTIIISLTKACNRTGVSDRVAAIIA